MPPEVAKLLYDIQQAVRLASDFIAGKALEDYQRDPMLRSALERQFEIIGEVMTQLAKLDSGTAERITEHRRIIAFRNILIHGYAQIDNLLVWDIAQSRLSPLQSEVEALLAEP